MNLNIEKLQDSLCKSLCAEVKLSRQNGHITMQTPFYFADGDAYQIYLKEMPGGILRVTDRGHTFMHLSYETDTAKLREGTRGRLFEQIKAEFDLFEANGEIYTDTSADDLSKTLFRFGQGLTKMTDLSFLNRFRTESTFYDDLEERLTKLVSEEKIQRNYFYPKIENSGDYPVDYFIQGKNSPLFLFGISGKDKARLTTIILERLLRAGADFDSLLVFADQQTIPKADLARLSNAGGEMVASLDAEADLSRKIKRKILI
ncbi:MAG: DUF1828 domain-containing protein [Balneolales bacterium]|nr:DUF1828 domain-containing protein [Balneolales bacterium]